MRATPVIAVIDVGKTNKKLFLFDQQYKIVFEQSARFNETVDEDGDACENLESLRSSVYDSVRTVFSKKEFDIKAINFSTYGASMVYIDDEGHTLTPLYNYLKPYPTQLSRKFYDEHGGEELLALQTASPVLGSLNSGLQLYRLKQEKPAIYNRIRYALHLPQYVSYLITNRPVSDVTSTGCHTKLWDFRKNAYHDWVIKEGLDKVLAPMATYDTVFPAVFPGGKNYLAGIGLHDSSASLIPYLVNFQEPFILISTGTWCISLNAFDNSPLIKEELELDCLCFMQYDGKPVKASRLFAGKMHEEGIRRIAAHFHQDPVKYRSMVFNPDIIASLQEKERVKRGVWELIQGTAFDEHELSSFATDEEAYHRLMLDIMESQVASTKLVMKGKPPSRIFVDGGFSKNLIYMNLLAAAFPDMEVFAASMAQATALGAALSIHKVWNKKPLPNDMIQLQYYGSLAKADI